MALRTRIVRSLAATGLVALMIPFAGPAHGAGVSVSITQQGFTVVGNAAWRVVVDLGGSNETGLNLEFVSYRRVDTRQQLADVIGGKLPQELDRVRYSVDELTRNDAGRDRKSTRLNSSHTDISRMPSSA